MDVVRIWNTIRFARYRSENHFLAKLSRSLMSNANQGKRLACLIKTHVEIINDIGKTFLI